MSTEAVSITIIMTSPFTNNMSLLNLMRLVSPALPIGAFAYSQGLEAAIDEDYIQSREDAETWLTHIFQRNIHQLDLPVLERLYQAYDDSDLMEARHWNQFVFASRETFELHKEELDIGNALGRLLKNLDQPNPIQGEAQGYLSQFAWAGVAWQISMQDLKAGYAFAWFENQIAAATKLIPLGQTDAQRALSNLSELIPASIAASIADDALNQSLPGLAAMSSRHENQPARLFRS